MKKWLHDFLYWSFSNENGNRTISMLNSCFGETKWFKKLLNSLYEENNS